MLKLSLCSGFTIFCTFPWVAKCIAILKQELQFVRTASGALSEGTLEGKDETMGLRGPAPKPTAIRIIDSNPGKRPLNGREPQPDAVEPRCPDHLDKDARKEWRRLVPILLRMRVLTEADGYSLANLCQAYSTMAKAQQKAQRHWAAAQDAERLCTTEPVAQRSEHVRRDDHEAVSRVRIDACVSLQIAGH
jgi:P27 family predicted phage terminase small subunit